MRSTPRLILALMLAMAPATVSAQLFAPVPQAVEYLNFVTGSGVGGTFGVQVGPYVGEFLTTPGGTVTSPQFSLYCVDYTHFAKDQWTNTSSLATSSDGSGLSLTRLGTGTTSFARYRQAAYLSSLFDSWNTLGFGTDQKTVWSGIHAAIWSVTSGTDVGSGSTLTIRNALLTGTWAAEAAGYDASTWYVLTPQNMTYSTSGQEFLVRTARVPEPSTLLLMASGLLIMLGSGHRRRERTLEA
jgi:hypothetical protein